LKNIERTLKAHDVDYHRGGAWTTDAPYRETPRKVKKYFKEGCLAVEMEASALFSIAKYRKKHIGALLNAGDCVAGKKWDSRSIWKDFYKEKTKMLRLLELSLESLHSLREEL
jgi:uridine phosphorylase